MEVICVFFISCYGVHRADSVAFFVSLSVDDELSVSLRRSCNPF